MSFQFNDLFGGGGGTHNQGAAVAGDLPSDGANTDDIGSILQGLSAQIPGVINAFTHKGQSNVQTRVDGGSPKSTGPAWLVPAVIGVVLLAAIYWFGFRKR
jgi:hypothetical protein